MFIYQSFQIHALIATCIKIKKKKKTIDKPHVLIYNLNVNTLHKYSVIFSFSIKNN